MTKLASIRKTSLLKLREVAEIIGTTPQTVHQMEKRGLRTPRSAQKYALAFPGYQWLDLLEVPDEATASVDEKFPPRTCADKQ